MEGAGRTKGNLTYEAGLVPNPSSYHPKSGQYKKQEDVDSKTDLNSRFKNLSFVNDMRLCAQQNKKRQSVMCN
jgi:hypothetical protein